VSDALAVGSAQVLALIPGSSRSGSTIMGGLFAGLTRETAARFSFLLSIPAIAASGLLELKEAVDKLAGGKLWLAGCRDSGFGCGRVCVDLVSVAISADALDECVHRLPCDCWRQFFGVGDGVYVGKHLVADKRGFWTDCTVVHWSRPHL
jgi:hypothetical protein